MKILTVNKRVLFLLTIIIVCAGNIDARKKVAVVFGGGGAKGAAEIGVLKYIEKSGIPVDYVVGTSIGSIVGGLYCAGYNSTEMDSLFCSQKWLSLMTAHSKKPKDSSAKNKKKEEKVKEKSSPYLVDKVIAFKRKKQQHFFTTMGILRGDSITSLLDDMIYERTGGRNFTNLKKPFRCIAVDINRFQEIELRDSNVAQAMRCSMSIPFVFKAVKQDSMSLIDGGVLNNLPVDVAREMGADIVIAIDLAVNTHEEADSVDDKNKKPFKVHVNNGPLNMREWKMKRPDIKLYRANVKSADIYIHPDLHGFGAQDFKHNKIKKMIALGEKAGEEALPKLEKLRKTLKNSK